MLTAKEEVTRVARRIKAGEKEAGELAGRVTEQKKALARLDKELAKAKEGGWSQWHGRGRRGGGGGRRREGGGSRGGAGFHPPHSRPNPPALLSLSLSLSAL